MSSLYFFKKIVTFYNIWISSSNEVSMQPPYAHAAVAVSAYLVPGIDVCPPVQEDLDGPEVAYLSSQVEGSFSILSDTQRDNTEHRYMEY